MNIKSVYSFVIVSSMLVWNLAAATPEGGQVAAGAATITQKGTTTTINQTSPSAVINWHGFDTASNETVQFNQPAVDSVVLNRINSGLPTNFAGTLNANGKVFIVNTAGVVFVGGSHVNTAGLVTTTLDVKDEDFMKGNYKFFTQDGHDNATIINNGTITTKDAGIVALIAPNTSNGQTGVIQADLGKVVLASGSTFVLDFNQDQLINFDASSVVKAGHVENAGIIAANNGKVFVTANDIAKVLDNTVSTSTVTPASTVVTKPDGSIVLGTSDDGMVKISGKINAGQVRVCAAKGINIDAPITATNAENGVKMHTQNGNIAIHDLISTQGDASVSLIASNGSISESGVGGVSTNNLSTVSASGTSLNSDVNAIHNFTAVNSQSGDIYLANSGNVEVKGITQNAGNLTISTPGSISQDAFPSHAIRVSGSTKLVSKNNGGINLLSDNAFTGPVNIDTNSSVVMQHSSHNLVLGNVFVGGDLDIENRAGAISQTCEGVVIVSGKTTLTTQDAPIALTNSGNKFSSWINIRNSIYSNQSVSLNNSMDTEIDNATAGGVLTLTVNGELVVNDSLNSFATHAPNGHSIIVNASHVSAALYKKAGVVNPGKNNSYLIYVPNTDAVSSSFSGNLAKPAEIFNTAYTTTSPGTIAEGNYLIYSDGQSIA